MQYIMVGRIHPERVSLTWPTEQHEIHAFKDDNYDIENYQQNEFDKITINIKCSQVCIVYSTQDNNKNINDILNETKQLLSDLISMIGFIKGYAYEVEITRLMNLENGIDIVCGIDNDYLNEKKKDKDSYKEYRRIISIFQENGYDVFIRQCFNDLRRAIKYPHDTPFFCHRALESLRNYCKYKYNIIASNEDNRKDVAAAEKTQWNKVCELTGYSEEDIDYIREIAKEVRHGSIINVSGEKRVKMLSDTWDIVNSFLDALENDK